MLELHEPTAELVFAACQAFDKDNRLAEEALVDLFGRYPGNSVLTHVLLKVVALDRLYSTGILAVINVAENIHACEVDAALTAGNPNIVDRIAKVTIKGKLRNN